MAKQEKKGHTRPPRLGGISPEMSKQLQARTDWFRSATQGRGKPTNYAVGAHKGGAKQ